MQTQTIVVTGAAGALGRAVIKAALARGARVGAIDVVGAGSASGDLGADVFFQGVVDLADGAAAVRALSGVKARFGAIDALFNIAGAFRWQTLEGADLGIWESLFRVNVLTAAATAQAALPHLFETRGAIVNVGANAASKAGEGMGAYGAAKAGVAALTQSLAEEVKARGVRVNAVLPSIIDTPANRADMPKADFSTWARPEEVARVMLFLASDEASGVTGALVPVVGRV